MLKRALGSMMVVLLLAACATSQQQSGYPPVSTDGLQLLPHTTLAAVYVKPGADLSQFDKLALLDPYVAFAKNWQRDYNEQATF